MSSRLVCVDDRYVAYVEKANSILDDWFQQVEDAYKVNVGAFKVEIIREASVDPASFRARTDWMSEIRTNFSLLRGSLEETGVELLSPLFNEARDIGFEFYESLVRVYVYRFNDAEAAYIGLAAIALGEAEYIARRLD